MKVVTFLGCLIISKIHCACVPGFYELVCPNLSDISKNEDAVAVRIGNTIKTPTERLSASVFEQTPNLEELTITSTINELENDAFRFLNKLLVLKLYKNLISVLPDFPFIQLPNLVKLDLQDNNIEEISTYGPFLHKTLRTVNLSFNKLRNLNSQCFAAPGLQTLIITNNKIREIGAKGVFSPDLITLNLANNEIVHLENAVFQDLQKLEELILSNNRFPLLWTQFNLKSLRKLDLSHNQIREIHKNAFDGLPQLDTVYLNHNILKELPPQLAKINLHAVHLHNNLLENLEMVYLNPSFEYELTFSKNPLPCLCLDNLNLFMDLRNITTTDCHTEYYKNGKTPSCIGIESEWDGGKCSYRGVIDEYLLQFLEMNKNIEC